MKFNNPFNNEDESDMIDMSNSDNYPDWAKEVNSKYGVGANRSPSSLPQYVHPEDIKSGEDMSSVYKSVFGNRPLKKQEEEESSEIERLKDTIKSYQEQGIKDSVQLLPLYNKLVELRQAKKQPESASIASSSASEGTPTNKYKSFSREQGLFSPDEMSEMAALPKRKKNVPMESEISDVESQIKSLTSQGINDSSKLVPLYNKLASLKTVQKSLLDVEQQKLDAENRKKFPAFYGEEPAKAEVPAIAAKPEAPLKSLSSKPKMKQSVSEEPLPSSTEQSASSADFDLESYLKSGKVSSSMDEDPLSFLNQELSSPESKQALDLDSYLNSSANSSPTSKDPLAFLNQVRDAKSSEAPSVSAKTMPSSKPVAGASAVSEQPSKVPVKPEAEQLPPSLEQKPSTLTERLENMQNLAAQARFMDTIAKGAEKLGAGISGAMSGYVVKPGETETFENLAKQIEENFKEKRAIESEDPDSEYSKGFREFAQPLVKQLGMDPKIIERLSGKQLGAVIPELRQMYENKVTSEYRQQALAESRADRAQRAADARRDRESLINQRTFATLPTRLENIGGPAGTRLRNRIQQAGNIYGTLGINPSDIDKMSDKQIEKRLDENKKLQAVEAAIELNSMLSGSAAPSQKTLEKLLLDSGYQRGMSALEFLSNEQFARNQGKYLKDIIKITSRAEKYALENLRNMEVRTLSGFRRLAQDDVVGSDFVNFINQRGIDLKDLDAAEKKALSEDEEAIKWAKENPNDPRAAEILKLQGQ